MPHQEKSLIFRLNDNGTGPEIIQQVFLEKGWHEYDEDLHQEHEWNIWWRMSRFRNSDYDQLQSWQWLNHYPRSTAITKKDCLARNMKRMKGVYGPNAYDFSPIAFNLPNDYTRFVAEYTKQRDKGVEACWICKPADLSRGRGIFIFKELSELQYDCNAVVQKYITNPLLISGYKFDLRIYVMVPSFHPLQIYIYEEGLVRFSTEKFDLNCLSNSYSHLTNTSINKHSPSYLLDKERIGAGCKWTIRQLRHYFHQGNINDSALWGKISNIILLTLVIQAGQVPKADHCFELYGFDIMIDDKLKPWLVEVNFSPALSTDCQVDIQVKKNMLHDLFEMIHFSEEDRLHGGDQVRDTNLRKAYGSRASVGRSSGSRSEHKQSASVRQKKEALRTSQKDSAGLPQIYSSQSVTTISESVGEGPESDSEPQVVPIVPGCGLPSVQQTSMRQVPTSPVCSPPASDIEDSSTLRVTDRSLVSNSARSSHDACRSGEARSKSVRNASSVSPHLGLPSHSYVKYPLYKRDSKYSVQSDSGISSYSASSESSDTISQMGEMSLAWKSANSSGQVHDGTDSVPTGGEQTFNSDSGVGCRIETESISLSQKTGSRTTRLPASQFSVTKRPPLSSRSTMQRHRNKLHSSLNGNQSASRKLNVQNTPFISKSLHQKPGSFNYHQNQASGNGVLRSSQPNLSIRTSHQGKNSHKIVERPTTAIPRVGTRCPPDRVGDFIRVFPFNEVTKKCSLSNMDVKSIIRECHKLLKERLKVIKGQVQTDEDGITDYTTSLKVFDIPLLWKPLQGDGQIH